MRDRRIDIDPHCANWAGSGCHNQVGQSAALEGNLGGQLGQSEAKWHQRMGTRERCGSFGSRKNQYRPMAVAETPAL
eukprot:9316243-Pyramimonas_sp.AAC.1